MRLLGRNLSSLDEASRSTYRKLVWLTFLRLLVVTVLLGATAVLTFTERDSLSGPVQARLYGLALVVYLATAIYLGLLRLGSVRLVPALSYAQIVGDVLMATYLVWLTGGNESIFSFLFSLAVIDAAILLSRRGAFVAAVLASVAYGGLIAAMQLRLLEPAAAYLTPTTLPVTRVVFNVSMNAGALLLVAALASWLTEQLRRADERLTEAQEDYAAISALLQSVVQSVTSGILTIDAAGRLTFLNRAGEELLALRGIDDRGRRLQALRPRLWEAMEASIPEAGSARGEVRLPAEGGHREIGFTVSPLAAWGGSTGGRVLVFQDLTAMRRMEALVQRNERLAALGSVAAGLAHEVRNPLASMSGSVELLKGMLAHDADEGRLLDIVLREAERLDRLLTDFLHFARPTPPEFEEVDLEALVRDSVAVLRHDPNLSECVLEVGVETGLRLRCDPGQLRQVLMNLVLNAAQATDGRGHIRIEGRTAGDEGLLVVSDDGPGLAPEVQGRIFDPFFTTKEQGTGLGLSLVHRMVEAHGGRVDVESEPGAGSRFIVVLPASGAPALAATGTEGS